MASTVSFSPANVQMLQARSGHGHAAFGSCSAVPRAGSRLRSTAVRVSSEQEAAVRAPSGRTIEECEADAVAGKFPAPPPLVRPKAPEGTPQIRPLDMTKRPRRNRKSPALRAAFQETSISPANFEKMMLLSELCRGAIGLGGGMGFLMRFTRHSPTGDEAYNDNGLVPRTIRLLKDKFPDIVIYTDVALDPYSSDGHDGIVREDGLPYLDIIRLLRDNSALPIAAYQVSGEYSMIKAGGALGMIDEQKVMMESLMCLRRAGADIILTYFARQAAGVLCGMGSK
nr:unnamed protein product [Digitaria exilis]CAB3471376.1 unnamed protein product [Digitaria exilis]